MLVVMIWNICFVSIRLEHYPKSQFYIYYYIYTIFKVIIWAWICMALYSTFKEHVWSSNRSKTGTQRDRQEETHANRCIKDISLNGLYGLKSIMGEPKNRVGLVFVDNDSICNWRAHKREKYSPDRVLWQLLEIFCLHVIGL